MNKLRELADFSALPASGTVIVGFSGGADSMALVQLLAETIQKDRILCVHVNHLLRAEESERDEVAAAGFCRRRGLRFRVFREDVAARARLEGIGLEECGRLVRYRCFESLLETGDDRILTAHNADDNAETMLMNFVRGAALTGLCGIPYKRGNIIRPLLYAPRAVIEEYCREEGLPFVTDSSNASDDYTRNRIRHAVMPVLKELNPQFVRAAAQTAQAISLDEAFLQRQAQALLESARKGRGLSAQRLGQADLAVRRRAVRLFLESEGCGRLSGGHINEAAQLLANGRRMALPGGRQAECSGGILYVRTPQAGESWQKPVTGEKTALPDGRTLILQKNTVCDIIKCKKVNKLLFNYSFDYGTIKGDLTARSRRSGDAFRPVDRHVTKTLKSLFAERQIPLAERNRQVILESGGEIVFVEGVGIAEAFRVTERSQCGMTIRIEEMD